MSVSPQMTQTFLKIHSYLLTWQMITMGLCTSRGCRVTAPGLISQGFEKASEQLVTQTLPGVDVRRRCRNRDEE